MTRWFLIGSLLVLVLLVLMVTIFGIPGVPTQVSAELQMGLVLVLAIGLLLILLYSVAVGFATIGLANREHAFALPEGSIRALIALFLIVLFVIMSVYLFRNVAGRTGVTLRNVAPAGIAELQGQISEINQNEDGTFNVGLRLDISDAGEQLALQLATILGTLVAAVSAFYFASATTASGFRAGEAAAVTTPRVDKISPSKRPAQDGQTITVTGAGFVQGMRVNLTQRNVAPINARDVIVVDPCTLTATFDLRNYNIGLYDVVILNSNGTEAVKKADSFQIV